MTATDQNSYPEEKAIADLESVSAEDFGRSLNGIGLNLLTRDVLSLQTFLSDVFAMRASRVSKDFAIMHYADTVFQLHADATFHSNPLLSVLPESGLRGAGIEIRLYQTDPDIAADAAGSHSHECLLLQAPTNKPHGLRECIILCENGYAWVPSRPLTDAESAAVA